MNIYQIIALGSYAILLFLFFYFATNKFEKGWLTNKSQTNKYNLDFNSFKLIAVVVVFLIVFSLKLLA